MSMTTELAQRMKAAAQEATQGEWWSDSVENDGFSSYAVYGADNRVLLDTLNSSAACIQEEYDDEGHTAWDEVGQRNAEFVAVANPANVLVLTAALEARDKQIANKNLELFKQSAHIAELTLSRKNAWKQASAARNGFDEQYALREAAEKRIAELEASSKAEHELFLRAKALMYCSGGAPIENSLNPIDAWLYDAERAAGVAVEGE